MPFILITLVFSIFSFAEPAETDSMFRIPKDTGIKLRLKDNLPVLANHGTTKIPRFEIDTDGDGIPDYKDWCATTPANSNVWTEASIKIRDNPKEFVGCSFVNKGNPGNTEVWLYEDKRQTPSGRVLDCRFDYTESPDTQYFLKNQFFKVIKGSFQAHYPKLTLQTVAGKEFKLICTMPELKTMTDAGNNYVVRYEKMSGEVSIKDLRYLFDIGPFPQATEIK